MIGTGILERRHGISFAEVSIAVIVLAVAMVPLISLMLAGHRGTATTVNQARSFHACQDVMEALKVLSFEDVTPAVVPEVEAAVPLLEPDLYTRTVTVGDLETMPLPGGGGTMEFRTIRIRVQWESRTQKEAGERGIGLATIVSRVVP